MDNIKAGALLRYCFHIFLSKTLMHFHLKFLAGKIMRVCVL